MALVEKYSSPVLPATPANIAKLRKNSILVSPYSTKVAESNNHHFPTEPRRSTRKIKKPNPLHIIHDHRKDPELKAALKRSKLETSSPNFDYSTIDPVPVVYATYDEFSNPIKLWNKYSSLGEEFGAIKVVPPEKYTGSLPIDLEQFEFQVRQQRLQFLSNGNGFSHPTQLWNCEKMRQYDKNLKMQIMKCENPTLESVEKEYWDMVAKSDPRVTSYYGADLNALTLEENMTYSYLINYKERDPWNLYNLPKCDGSLLKHIKGIVPGVNSPWLYIGMIFTTFCWHTEDNYFGSVNYHHKGASKVWYFVPPRDAEKMETIMKNYASLYGEDFALYGLSVQIPPDILIANGVTVYRTVQNENEFVLVWPRTFHSGFNAGINVNEACNLAPGNWIKMGYQSLLNYKYARKSCIPFFRILLSAIPNVVELEPAHIKSIMDCLSLLIIEEFKARANTQFPTYQMFYDTQMVDRVPEITDFFMETPKTDFDYDLFINSLHKSNTINEYEFVVACKEMSEFCIKDCDMCDSPTFGSAVICNHNNTVVCLSCQKYHDCPCDTRVVLYRYPLLMFHAILLILKKLYNTVADDIWNTDREIRTPTVESLAKVDAQSFFNFRDLYDLGHDNNPKTRIIPDDQTLEVEFDEIVRVCRCLRRSRLYDKTPRKLRDVVLDGPSNTGELCTDILSVRNIIHISKLTLKYTLLALEEDKMESA